MNGNLELLFYFFLPLYSFKLAITCNVYHYIFILSSTAAYIRVRGAIGYPYKFITLGSNDIVMPCESKHLPFQLV